MIGKVNDVLTIFRIENPDTQHGMWYEVDGSYNPYIFKLTEGISAGLPMDPHERYGQRGRRWYSGCVNPDSLRGWFSSSDAQELFDVGYRLYEFKSTEYEIEEHQVIFTREGIHYVQEIPLGTIFNLTSQT